MAPPEKMKSLEEKKLRRKERNRRYYAKKISLKKLVTKFADYTLVTETYVRVKDAKHAALPPGWISRKKTLKKAVSGGLGPSITLDHARHETSLTPLPQGENGQKTVTKKASYYIPDHLLDEDIDV